MKWWFALGAAISSTIWFTSLGFGSRYASRLMSRPVTWRILDIAIGVIVSGVAVNLAFTALPK
jgi:L-lysine exporter family protein LysE/ArgO